MNKPFARSEIIIIYTRKIFFYTLCNFYDNIRIFETERIILFSFFYIIKKSIWI